MPGGSPGIRATLRIMRNTVRKAKHDPELREFLLRLIGDLPEKAWMAEVRRIHEFVRDRIRYVKDIAGVETVHWPQKTLEYGQGDCDDKAVLAATLLQMIDHPARFVAVGFNGEPLSHVYVETKKGDQWIPMELTEYVPLGTPLENVTSQMVEHI